MLYLVEYADYNCFEKTSYGVTRYRFSTDDKAIASENNVNRIIVSSSIADLYDVGQRINIGVNGWDWSCAKKRTITNKIALNEGVAIYFDGDAVNIQTGYVLSSFAGLTGGTEELGMKSGTLNNDGKHSMIYRGIENIYGYLCTAIDGINIKDNYAYVSYKQADYDSKKIDGSYQKIGYINATNNGRVNKLGYDSNNPLIAFPVVSGSGFGNYMQNSWYTVVNVGGGFSDINSASLWSFTVHHSPDMRAIHFTSRLIRI